MNNQLKTPYFYSGIDINKFKFYAAPQLLFDSPDYDDLSIDAKVLYSIMLDKTILSHKHPERFSDEEGKIYIIYKNQDIEKDINKTHTTVSKLLKELEEYGLIEKRRSKTVDRTNRIYVKGLGTFEKKDGYLYKDFDFDKYLFYMLPKEIIVNPHYKKLSLTGKVLYMFLLDRVKLSKMNKEQFSDEDGRVYVLFAIENIMKRLNCSKHSAIKAVNELVAFNLLEKDKLGGFNNTNKYYVLDFAVGAEVSICSEETAENVEILQHPNFAPSNIQNLDFPTSKICTLQEQENALFNIQNLHPNNTYNNNTNKSYSHQSNGSGFEETFFNAIELDTLTTVDKDLINDIVAEGDISGIDYDAEFNKLKNQKVSEANIYSGIAKAVVRYVNRCGSHVSISGYEYDKQELIDKLLTTTSTTFMLAKDKLMSTKKTISNYDAYAVSVLLDVIDTKDIHYAQRVNSL